MNNSDIIGILMYNLETDHRHICQNYTLQEKTELNLLLNNLTKFILKKYAKLIRHIPLATRLLEFSS